MEAQKPKPDMLTKALQLLVLLGQEPNGAKTADLARVAGLPFNTVYRLLRTLVNEGFAYYDSDARVYQLGLQIFQLGQKVSHAQGFAGVARPILEKVTALTREATVMAVRQGEHQITVNKVEGPQAFRVADDAGHAGPLHATAVGKVLIAFAGEEEREQLLDDLELEPFTEHTITDRQVLRSVINDVQQQGYATMVQENELGMHALAVPVLSQSGKALAALAIAAPVFRLEMDDLMGYLPNLKTFAAELAVRLPQR